MDLPVFAIEHSLETATVRDITVGLHSRVARGEPLGKHWLLWVVYAAELGYDYDGEEYWPSFDNRTPHWSYDLDRRRQLRQWFLRFHKLFAGVQPTGPWASQFSIIAWPITHALLPKDLQTQLAGVLYEQRYFVAEFIDAGPSQVGHLIASSAYHSSSRLRNFLEQEELAGRIVLALLGVQRLGTESAVLDATLQRIVADLEAARDGRVWLKEARSAIASAKARLVARAKPLSQASGSEARSSVDTEGKSIRPRLVLIRDGVDSWTATVELPSFSGLAALNARIATCLRSTRCKVTGTGSGWNPRGWLLYGNQRKRLLSWPDPLRPVVTFEEWNDTVFHLLTNECRISAGPVWLFRVNRDGTATEVVGRQVRLGADYVVLRSQPLSGFANLRPLSVSCEGIAASILRLPPDTTEEALQSLVGLGLRLERTLKVWPVGLPPVHWDGEAQLEWLSGDSLCIGLSHDSACSGISVHVDGGRNEGEFIQVQANQPAFVSLGQLSPGVHTLSVAAAYPGRATERVHSSRARLTISILVRPPRRWVPGTSGHAGLIVATEPQEPTLDEVLGGRARVSVVGPEGREVLFGLELLDAGGSVLTSEVLGTVSLPMRPADWQRLIEVRAAREADPSIYLRASGGRLLVEADGLGCTRIPLTHSVIPIRWLARGTNTIDLTLVNDTGHEDPVVVEFATFRDPTTPVAHPVPDPSSQIRPQGRGGLYVATAGSIRASIVVSVSGRGGLQDLADRPQLGGALNDGAKVASLLGWIRDWSHARTVGPLGAQRRSLVLRGMEDQLFETMCWQEWIRAERNYRESDPVTPDAQERLENSIDGHISFALGLSRAKDDVLTDSIGDSARSLLGHAIRYHICGDQVLCEAALRLAGTPDHFADWAGSNLVKVLDALVKLQPLLRGARMVVLLMGEEGRRRTGGWYT